MPDENGYLSGYLDDLTGGKPAAPPAPEATPPAIETAAEESSRRIILEAKDISVRFRVRRPSGGLIRRYLKGAAADARLSSSGRTMLIRGLSGVSLTLREGEHVGLVGVNGSGKTTLLRTISGILSPESGSLSVTKNIYALLSVSAGFDNELSAYDNLRLRALYSGIPDKEIEAHIADVMAFSGLGEFFFLPMKIYSAGMKARFALGLSTITRPELLIMDEWVGAGDMDFRAKAHKRFTEFVSNSGALLIASHSYAILQAWVTRLVWMHEGKVMADGPRDQVFAEYKAFLDKNR
jgi:lipopolysaccharide transport system ATP-binding protein